MSTVTSIKLNDGSSIPSVGFGIGTAHFGQECIHQVSSALKVGYTYLDAAQMYANSESIAAALKQSGKKREEVYVLTKCGKDHPRKALESELKKLGLDYVDMYLMHSPLFSAPISIAETWKIMEDLKSEGLTKSIGVSNYREEDIKAIENEWKLAPAVNQIEYHPYVAHAPNMQRLLTILSRHGIKVQAYGPLSPIVRYSGGPLDAVAAKIAEKHKATDSQVLLAWAAQTTGGVIVTTSRQESRQKEQLDFAKVQLDQEDIDAITKAGSGQFSRKFMEDVWEQAKE